VCFFISAIFTVLALGAMEHTDLGPVGLDATGPLEAAQVPEESGPNNEDSSPLTSDPSAAAGQSRPQDGRQEYADPTFWESRFREQEGMFDWYATFSELSAVFNEFCPPNDSLRLLMVGCGNSELSAQMHAAGYHQITNIDIAPAAVEKMSQSFADLNMDWKVMDATAMSFPDHSFGLAVDKGTLDAMMSGDGASAAPMVAEIHRTLKPGGIFVLVSHNGRRQQLLDGALQDAAAGEGQEASPAGWEVLELRRNRLSPQATLINVLRSKLKGRPLVEAFRDPEMMREAAVEAKTVMKQMALLECFRLFKARKRAQSKEVKEAKDKPDDAGTGGQSTAASTSAQTSGEQEEEDDDGEVDRDPQRQPFCWVYVLRKR